MEAVKAHTWNELVEQAEIAEKLTKKFESSTSRWRTNKKDHDMAKSFDNDTLAVKVSGTKTYQRQYSFKNKHVVIIFYLLYKGNKLSYQRLDAPTKLDAQTIPTIIFFIGWFVILLADVMSLRTKCKR